MPFRKLVARASQKDEGKAKARATMDKNKIRRAVECHLHDHQAPVLNKAALRLRLTPSLKEEPSGYVTKVL